MTAETRHLNWYQLRDPEMTDSPALLVFPERIKANIQTAIQMSGSAGRLRPHVKTSKSPDAVHLMQEAGIDKFKCATISEAEMLGMKNAKDVLLAYQPVGPKLERFIELVRKYPGTHYSCLVDNLETANQQVAAFSAAGVKGSVYFDLNVGMNRSGIAPGPEVIELIKYLSGHVSIQSVGLHIYDGHIRSQLISDREKEVDNYFDKVDSLLNQMKVEGVELRTPIFGGSPTFPVHAKRNKGECSPGTFVYWDKGYSDLCPEQNFLPAAIVFCRVISLPAEKMVTVDLGHKSIASENEITRRVYFPDEKDLVPVSHSEEHLVLRNDGSKVYRPGDVLYGIPFHICPTVALFERALTVESGIVTGTWINSARDRKIQL